MRFSNIVETLSDKVGAEPTEAGKMLPLAPSGSETLSNATSQLSRSGMPCRGRCDDCWGRSWVVFFPVFLNHLLLKNRPRERSDRGRFCHRQLRELYSYEADFHKPGIYGSRRVWVNARDVLRRAPSRGGRGRRAAVDIVVCFGRGGFFIVLFFSIFFLRTRTACCKYETTLPHLHLY